MKKYILLILCSFIFILIIINIALKDPFRSKLKNEISQKLKLLISWDKHNQKFAVNQLFSHNQPFIIYSEQLIYKNNELITLLFAGETSARLYIKQFDNNGNIKHIDSLDIESSLIIEPLYSSLYGYIGKTNKHSISPKIKNGWVQIEVYPKIGKKINLAVFIEDINGADILFVESTDTFNAYVSAYGLPTHYSRKLSPLGAFTRPKSMPQNYKIVSSNDLEGISCNSHLVNADLVWKKFLNKNKINFKSVSDNYLDDYKNFNNCKTLIFGSHNEYWTHQKAKNILNFVNDGGHVIFLGGNTAWRAVERHNDFDVLYGDDLRDNGFEDIINELLGSYFDSNGYDTYAAYKISNTKALKRLIAFDDDIKIFAEGTSFNHCKDIIYGGSGHETDKLLNSANKEFILLAEGINRSNGGANLVFRDIPDGGSILNFGSVSLWHNSNDQIINKLVLSRLKIESSIDDL